MRYRACAISLLSLAGLYGCSAVDVEMSSGAQRVENGIRLNGIRLNGIRLNGIRLNGIRLNGIRLNGIRLNGIRLNGIRLNGIRLNGSLLSGIALDGSQLSGADFVGAELEGMTESGTVLLRIDGVAPAEPEAASHPGRPWKPADLSDVFVYTVSYQTDDGWTPLCGSDDDGASWAIPLAGRWNEDEGVVGGGSHIDDPTTFTFACQAGALAKCVEAGYLPWRRLTECGRQGCHTTTFAAHHQACTRTMRADYCGDGRSWTREGTEIDIYDRVGVQFDTEHRWRFEAEWVEEGALCAERPRSSSLTPPCMAQLVDRHCGAVANFATGTLIMDRVE